MLADVFDVVVTSSVMGSASGHLHNTGRVAFGCQPSVVVSVTVDGKVATMTTT